MYEQYTDKQIVEMLVPKLNKATKWCDWKGITKYPERNENLIKAIATIYRSAYIRGQLGRNFIIGEPKRTETKRTEHWVPAAKDNVKVGSKVRMIEETAHKGNPQWFPDVGTVGIVMEVGFHTHLIQWPEGSTSERNRWYCDDTRLEVLLCE